MTDFPGLGFTSMNHTMNHHRAAGLWIVGFVVCILSGAAAVAKEPIVELKAPSPLKAGSLPAQVAIAPPASERFATDATAEIPDFQKHITPLLGRLGCNGRACHGSFQGRGDFRLSLFGYDFRADHAALMEENAGRVDVDDVDESLILAKPIDAEMHEGGQRMERGSWQYNTLRAWIAAGAKFDAKVVHQLERLEVTPSEIQFSSAADTVSLHVVAHWSDGTAEDVTELCRFTTNDDAIAAIDESGRVSCGEPGDTHVVVSYDNAVVPVAVLHPVAAPRVTELPADARPIDVLVQEKLDKLGIVPSQVCSDRDFVRRASLDITGTLPAPETVREFLQDSDPSKRERYVEDLLESPSYAAWWATRLSDWTGNSEAQLNNVLPARNIASKLWYEWLRERLKQNVAYDAIVEGIVVATSRQPDEDYTDYCEQMSDACRPGGEASFASRDGMPLYWARRNFRQPEERAIGFAYAFLGVRIECAQCHKHPFDQWSKDDFDNFAKLFTPINASPNAVARESRDDRQAMLEELGAGEDLRGNLLRRMLAQSLLDGKTVPFPELVIAASPQLNRAKAKAAQARKNGKQVPLRIPTGKILGESDEVELDEDPRVALMRWLRSPENPYFAKAIVNRVWANYFGVGIVNPTDDMNLGNPPSNAALLDYLATEFIEQGFDLKWLHREIVLSDTYQRSADVNETNRLDRRNFSRHVPRRYPSEVVHDAVLLATASDEQANQARETLTGLAITDAIALYGTPRSNTFALQVFGRSDREANCDCDRSDSPSLLQSVYLRNDADIHRRLADRRGWVSQTCRELGIAPSAKPGPAAVGKAADRATQIQDQIFARVEQFQQLPRKRQQKVRPQLQKQYQQSAKRLREFGVALPPLASLLQGTEAIDDGASAENANATTRTESERPAVASAAFEAVVENAYLRTLSRFPEPAEMQTSLAFINDSTPQAEAVESLLWALLNTKEFILSH